MELGGKMNREKEIALAVFDTRLLTASDRLGRELRGWCGFARVEWVDENHALLLASPGGALALRDAAMKSKTLKGSVVS
jgi:hypothetical protein